MAQNIVLAFYVGGGGNAFSQIIMAEQGELITGQSLFDITNITMAGSAGNFAALTSMSQKPEDVQSVFTPLRGTFKNVAKKAICGSKRQDQVIRGVLHDIHSSLTAPKNPFLDIESTGTFAFLKDSLKTRAARAVCKNHSDNLHLDPTPLSKMMVECFGADSTLNHLPKSFISFSHHHETQQNVCFSNIGKVKPDILNGDWKDYFIPNYGGHHLITDTVMASIAAPTLFPAHQINGQHFVDCASFITPLPVVKNILQMAGKHKDDIHIHVLQIGTGYQKTTDHSAINYNNLGTLKAQRAYINFRAAAQVNQEMQELKGHFSKYVTLHTIDVEIPEIYNGFNFEHDPFNGSSAYLSAIEDITVSAIKNNPDIVVAPIEKIAEQKAIENQIDPLAAPQTPSFLTKLLRMRGSSGHPASAVAKPTVN